MRFTLAAFAGTFGALVAGTLIAILMQPWIAPQFGEYVRTEADGLLFPSLIGGYIVIGACLAYLAPKLNLAQSPILEIVITGLVIGIAIFLGDHLITAGWSYMPVGPMVYSGILDSFCIVIALLAVCGVYKFRSDPS